MSTAIAKLRPTPVVIPAYRRPDPLVRRCVVAALLSAGSVLVLSSVFLVLVSPWHPVAAVFTGVALACFGGALDSKVDRWIWLGCACVAAVLAAVVIGAGMGAG